MAEYYNVTTNLGDAEIAAAITNNAKIQITHIAFGDGAGSVPTPSKTRTTLVREVHRQAVTKYERHPTNPNWIVIETIIPSDIGGFTIREMGIIGNGKLISHGSHAPFEKVADPSGVSEYRLKFTQNITDGNVVSITLDDSLIYATQAWVEENFIKRNEIIDDLTTDDATKPVSAKQAKLLQDNKVDKDKILRYLEALTETKILSPDGKSYFYVTNKDFGLWDIANETSIAMSVTLGGTGANNASGARSNLGLGLLDTPTFAGINFGAFIKGESGYRSLGDNFLLQWGTAATSSTNDVYVPFPVVFPNACLCLVGVDGSIDAGSAFGVFMRSAISTFGFSCSVKKSISERVGDNASWIAIGH